MKIVDYENNSNIQGILQSFPSVTELIGVILPEKNIIIFEGNHRSTALALIAQQKKEIIINEPLSIALTFFTEEDELLINDVF